LWYVENFEKGAGKVRKGDKNDGYVYLTGGRPSIRVPEVVVLGLGRNEVNSLCKGGSGK